MSSRHSEDHPKFPQPANRDARVWRYFTWPRYFVDTIKNRSIWFSRSDLLGDPCEGTRPLGDAPKYAIDRQREIEAGGAAAERWAEVCEAHDRYLRATTFVSCWQMAECDMIPMWERYCVPRERGVAIQTTYELLNSAVPGKHLDRHIMLGLVKYGDYDSAGFESDLTNVFSTFMIKRMNYVDEREVRLVVAAVHGLPVSGFYVKVSDWSVLIERIVVSPYAAKTFVRLVEKFCRDEGITAPVSAIHGSFSSAAVSVTSTSAGFGTGFLIFSASDASFQLMTRCRAITRSCSSVVK